MSEDKDLPPNLRYPPTWALGIFCPWCNPIIFKRPPWLSDCTT
jgi:hypothetical protein